MPDLLRGNEKPTGRLKRVINGGRQKVGSKIEED